MKKEIQIVRDILKANSLKKKSNGKKELLGLCGIIFHARNDKEISEEAYDLIKGKIREKQKATYKLWDSDGYRTLDDSQFIWKPTNYKVRDNFLKNIQDNLK